jgi:hypothetical protein
MKVWDENSTLHFIKLSCGDRVLILRLLHYNGDDQSKVRKQMLVGLLFVNSIYKALDIVNFNLNFCHSQSIVR